MFTKPGNQLTTDTPSKMRPYFMPHPPWKEFDFNMRLQPPTAPNHGLSMMKYFIQPNLGGTKLLSYRPNQKRNLLSRGIPSMDRLTSITRPCTQVNPLEIAAVVAAPMALVVCFPIR